MNSLTCVYCGMAYPEGTPPYGSQVLTDHIKVCEKHPLRAAEATIAKLRAALAGDWLVWTARLSLNKWRQLLA